MASVRSRIGERWRLLRLRRSVPPSPSGDSTGKARRRAWVEAILPAAALGTLLLLGGGAVLSSGGSGGGSGVDSGGGYLPPPPAALPGVGALVGESDAVEGWALPWEATPTVCRLHGACVTREGGLVLPAWVGRGREGGVARRLLRACGLTGRRAPSFADPPPRPPPPPAAAASADAAADDTGRAAHGDAADDGGAGDAAAGAAAVGRYLPADLVLLDAHGAAATAGSASRLYRLLRGQAYVRAVAGVDGSGGGGGGGAGGWLLGWWAALRRHHRYSCAGVARATCALLPLRPLRPVVDAAALASVGAGGVGAVAAAAGEPWTVPAPAAGPGAPAVLATAAAPSADGLVCYRSVVAGTTDLARVPVGGLAWRRQWPPLPASSAEGGPPGLPSVRLSRLQMPCRLRVVLVVPVVTPGRRPHHLENLYALQDALQAAAPRAAPADAATASPGGVPALPVASLPLAAAAAATAAAAAPLELTVTSHHPEALNDSAAALAAADIVILPHDPAYAAAVGLLAAGAAVVELYPFAAAPPVPHRRRAATTTVAAAAAAQGGAVSRRASRAAAAAAADGSMEPAAAAVGVAVTPVGGLPDGDTFTTCLGASAAAASSRRAAAKLLRRWRRAARRAGRAGPRGGGAAGAAALPPVRGASGGFRAGVGRSPLRRAADACVAAQATVVDVPRVVAVVADHVRRRCVR